MKKALKICNVGARKALLHQFVEKGAVSEQGEIINQDLLFNENARLRSILKEKYGITRNFIFIDKMYPYIQFDNEVVNELDAIHGLYYPENKKYQRDFNTDRTLSPIELVSKYLTAANTESGIRVKRYSDFNIEEVEKFKIGIALIYPNVNVIAIKTKNLKSEQLYKIAFVVKPKDNIQIIPDNVPGDLDELYNQKEQQVIEETMAPLLSKFKGVQVNWVTEQEMEIILSQNPKVLISNNTKVNGVAIRNQVYLVKGKVDSNTALEELMHMFVDNLISERKALFHGLLNQAGAAYPLLRNKIEIEYGPEDGFTQEHRDIELVTRALRDAYVKEREERPEGVSTSQFLKLAREFFKWITDKLGDIFNVDFNYVKADVSKLPLNATLGEIATYLNVNGIEFTGLETLSPRFNLDPGTEEFDQSKLDQEIAADKKTTIKEIKIEKITDQIKRINRVIKKLKSDKSAVKMVETLEKLLENSRNYKKLLEDDTDTTSVTKFVGSPLFPEGLSKQFEKYQKFGTFIHLFMEELQLTALETGFTPLQLLNNNPGYFSEFYERNIDKIQIPGLSAKGSIVSKILEEKLSDDLINIVGFINEPFSRGEIIIPEITVHGIDSLGRVIDGRLDYVVIRKDGTASIKDFKTTRSKYAMTRYSDKSILTQYSTTSLSEGVHPAFERFSGRSKASGFLSQIGAYKRILGQMGVITKGDSIINIVYSPNKEELEEGEGEWVYENMFVADVPIEGDAGLSIELDENGIPTAELSPLYKRVLLALRSSLPISGELTIDDTMAKAKEDINYIASLPQEKMKLIIEGLQSKIDKQLQAINAELSRMAVNKADDSKIREIRERRQLLLDAKNWFNRTFIENGEVKNIPEELILKGLLDKTRELAKSMRNSSEKIVETESFNTAIKILSERNHQFNDLKDFLETFKKSLLAINTIDESNPVIRDIDEAVTTIEKGQSYYIELAGTQFVTAILELPKKNVEEMMKSMELLYEHQIERLERIIAGDVSVFDTTKMWLGNKLKKVFGRGTKEITQDMKDSAQQKLDKIKYFVKHKEFNKEFVEMYVDNTFKNPESGFYIGSTIQQGFGGLTGDDFRASYGNSELAITAMANYAIKMTQNANMKFFDRMEALKVGSFIKKFTNKFGSYQAANEAISQKVSIMDYESGKATDYMMYRNPIYQDYFNKIDEFDYSLNKIQKQKREIKESDKTEDQKKAELKALDIQSKEIRKQYSTWLVDNAETKLVPELYLLEVALPDDIREKIELINKSIDGIKSRANNRDWNLDEADRLDIKKYEAEIALLKKQAILEDPDLLSIYQKLDEYYEYHVNEGGYEYARAQVLKSYPEDSKEYQIWLDMNSNLIPDPKWVDDYNKLLDDKRALYDEDTQLSDLFESRRNLISKYKFRSASSSTSLFNPLYMNDDDYFALTQIEDMIDNRLSELELESVGNFMSKEDKNKLARIKKEIGRIKQSQNKPDYDRELNDRISEIIRINTEIGHISDLSEKAKMQAQLDAKDLNFKKWYDRNNTTVYKLGSIVNKGKVDASPRSFNTMAIPTDPSLMIRVPNSNYRTRSYKAAAYNPEYSPTLEKRRYGQGSYPMPKGIKYDNNNGRFNIIPGAKWANPKYLEMARDPEVLEFFNKYVMDEYYNKQVGMSANKLGFFYPGDTQSAFETLATDGLEGAKREAREWINNNVIFGNSEIEKANNRYGLSGQHRIRFSHNYKLSAEIGTKDGINAIMKWGLQYEIYQAMEEANFVISPMIDFLKSTRKDIKNEMAEKQVSKVIDIMEFERNKFIYGKTFDSPDDSTKSVAGRKIFRQFMSAVSWGRLAFDPAMQAGNLVSGNVQMFLASQREGTGLGTWKDWAFAKLHMYGRDGFMYNVILDWGKIDDVSLSSKILRYFNPSMKSYDKSLDVANRGTTRRLLNKAFSVGDLAYVIQDKGEMEIAMSTLLKNLSAHKFYVYEMEADGKTKKLDAQGNSILKKDTNGDFTEVSAFDALVDNGSGTPGIRPDVAMSMDDLEAIRARTHQEYILYQGNYSDWNQTRSESNIFGVLFMFFRKYLEPFVEARFKGGLGIGDPKNWAAGEAQIGWWTAFFRIFRDNGIGQGLLATLPGFITERTGLVKYNAYFKSKAAQVRREVLFATLAAWVYTTLRSLRYGDDDDKADLTWAEMQGMRLLAKVSNESRSMVYIPYIGKGDDFIQNFGTFTSAFNEGKTVFKGIENFGYYIAHEVFDSESAFQRGYYQRKAYRYDAGDPKVLANFYSLTGIENVLDVINPEFAVSKQYLKQ